MYFLQDGRVSLIQFFPSKPLKQLHAPDLRDRFPSLEGLADSGLGGCEGGSPDVFEHFAESPQVVGRPHLPGEQPAG
jgi:hypothetical protein